MTEKEYMTWEMFDKACQQIAEKLKAQLFQKPVNKIYGIPRGGIPLANKLSQLLNIPVINQPQEIDKHTLIVDDISDTGKTLYKLLKPFPAYVLKQIMTATLYYNKQSSVKPNIWIYEKVDKWIQFPWEE